MRHDPHRKHKKGKGGKRKKVVRYRWLIGLVISSVAILLASIQFIGHDDGAVVYLDIETRVELSTTICTPTTEIKRASVVNRTTRSGFLRWCVATNASPQFSRVPLMCLNVLAHQVRMSNLYSQPS